MEFHKEFNFKPECNIFSLSNIVDNVPKNKNKTVLCNKKFISLKQKGTMKLIV